ncbi:hypothetical protein TNCV_3729241, partial [Trichonephila clavipes]
IITHLEEEYANYRKPPDGADSTSQKTSVKRGGYHPYGLASILTGLESIEHVWGMLRQRIAVYRNLEGIA